VIEPIKPSINLYGILSFKFIISLRDLGVDKNLSDHLSKALKTLPVLAAKLEKTFAASRKGIN
jgi:hypothetical protein